MTTNTYKIPTFYRVEMAPKLDEVRNFSKSPLKPRYLMETLEKQNKIHILNINKVWKAFSEEDFYLAHEVDYVKDFFAGIQPECESNGLTWSKEFARSVRFTNASLYYAILYSIQGSEKIAFSPTSGFHHATPNSGRAFCSFSGQVIASSKIYRSLGMVGAYLDLDGHFGNSIEDSRDFVKDLDKSIPVWANVNPQGTHGRYIKDLHDKLEILGKKIRSNSLHYIVYCHGADSHVDDDLGGQVDTKEWTQCTKDVLDWKESLEKDLGRKIPFTLALFGGYRKRNYQAVLDLHISDLDEIYCRMNNMKKTILYPI